MTLFDDGQLSRRNFNISCLGLLGSGLLTCSFPARTQAGEGDFQLGSFNPHIPEKLGTLLVGHIDTILEKGYAADISPKDFFHGHLLWKPGKKLDKAIFEGSMESVAGILYHTAEYTKRWAAESDLPYHQRTPRSIFGALDGKVTPVRDLLDMSILKTPHVYQRKGTVYETEFAHQLKSYAQLSWPEELDITAASQFDFGFLKKGRFQTSAGRIDAHFSTQWP